MVLQSGLFALITLAIVGIPVQATRPKPNIIIFLADDIGYGDLAAYGNAKQESGPIEKMAKEGVKFTQWTSPSFLCTPSRSALLTGRYARRSGIYGNSSSVFGPSSSGGLPSSEITLAEALKSQGYATGMVGKWHLGINSFSSTDGTHLPHNHGFDYVGTNLPLGQSQGCGQSESNGRGNRRQRQFRSTSENRQIRGNRANRQATQNPNKSCFLYNGSEIVQQPINTSTLTSKLVLDALSFIRNNKKSPFFLYFALPQAHPTWFCSENFCGKSKRGEYGDVLNEMASAVGSVISELKMLGIDRKTLAIFSSDHGARRSSCNYDYTNGPFRDGKGTTWEGGIRVPAIAWWPGTLPANAVSNNFVNHLDIFPTALTLAGAGKYLRDLSTVGVQIDGQLIPDLFRARRKNISPRNTLFYYCSDRLMAVRLGNYKIYYRTMGPFEASSGCESPKGDYSCYNGTDIVEHDPPIVVNLANSQNETVAETKRGVYNYVVRTAKKMVTDHEASFSVAVTPQLDAQSDKSLLPCCNPPSCNCN